MKLFKNVKPEPEPETRALTILRPESSGFGKLGLLQTLIPTVTWVLNPFEGPIPPNLSLLEKNQLIDLRKCRQLKIKFQELNLEEFWLRTETIYETIGSKALTVLRQFATTYNCEVGFSALVQIKTNKRARLETLDEELRVNLSNIEPQYEKLVNNLQLHSSH